MSEYNKQNFKTESSYTHSATESQLHLPIEGHSVGVFGAASIEEIRECNKLIVYMPGGAALFNSGAGYAKAMFEREILLNPNSKTVVLSLGHPGSKQMRLQSPNSLAAVQARFDSYFSSQGRVIEHMYNSQELQITGHSIGTLTALGTAETLIGNGISPKKIDLIMPVGITPRKFSSDLFPRFMTSSLHGPIVESLKFTVFNPNPELNPNFVRLWKAGVESAIFDGGPILLNLLNNKLSVNIFMSKSDPVLRKKDLEYFRRIKLVYDNLQIREITNAPHYAPNVFPNILLREMLEAEL